MSVSGAACITHQSPHAHQPKLFLLLHLMENFLGDWHLFPVKTLQWVQIYSNKNPSLILCCKKNLLWLVSSSGEHLGPFLLPPPCTALASRGAAAPQSLLRAAVLEHAAPAAPASFGQGVPASNQSSFMLSLQTRAQTFNHSS